MCVCMYVCILAIPTQIDVFLDTVRPDVYNPQALITEQTSLQKVAGPHRTPSWYNLRM